MADVNIPTVAIIMGVLIFVLLILGIYFRFFYQPTITPDDFQSTNVYTPNYQWGAEKVTPGSTCRGYEFGIQMVSSTARCGTTEKEVEYLSMESPTFDRETLDNMESTSPYNCVDSDQINAIEVVRVCNQLVSGFDASNADKTKTWCPRDDGTFASYGEEYKYYTPCTSDTKFGNTSKPLYCAGSIAGVSIGFQEQGFGSVPCLDYNSETNILTIQETCDLSQSSQQFRVIRTTDPTIHPSVTTTQGSAGNKGIYMAIVHRETGLCLMPQTITNKPILGSDLSLRNCSENQDGFVWALIPPINYSVDSDGDFDPNALYKSTSPQQLVYIGATSNPNFQLNRANSDSIGTFLTNYRENYTLSVFNNVGAPEFGQYKTCTFEKCNSGDCVDCDNRSYNAEIATISLYNNLVARCS